MSSGSLISSTKSNVLLIPPSVVLTSRCLNWGFVLFFMSILNMLGLSYTSNVQDVAKPSVLMSLSTNLSPVSFRSQCGWIDRSHFEVFSCSSACPATFDWLLRVVHLTPLGAGYFDTPLNGVELCSVVWLSYLDVVCLTAPEKSHFPTPEAIPFRVFSLRLPDVQGVLAGGQKLFPAPCKLCFLHFFWGISPRLVGDPLYVSGALSRFSSPLWSSALLTITPFTAPNSELLLPAQGGGGCLPPPGPPASVSWGALSRQQVWLVQGSPNWFPHFQGSLLCLPGDVCEPLCHVFCALFRLFQAGK